MDLYLKYKAPNTLLSNDNMDPALDFDRLPQPYRMISKILEYDILDQVWLTIIRAHPEVQIGSNGKQLFERRNKNLEIKCLPSSVNIHHETTTSMKGFRSYVYMASSVGSFAVYDILSGRVKSTLGVFKFPGESFVKIWDVTCIGGEKNERVLLSNITQNNQIVGENISPSKQTIDSVSEPLITYICSVAVVDVTCSNLQSLNTVDATLMFVLDFEFTCDPQDIKISISEDGQVVSILQQESNLNLYWLKNTISSDANNSGTGPGHQKTIAEDSEIIDFTEIRTITLSEPTCSIDLKPFVNLKLDSMKDSQSVGNSPPSAAAPVLTKGKSVAPIAPPKPPRPSPIQTLLLVPLQPPVSKKKNNGTASKDTISHPKSPPRSTSTSSIVVPPQIQGSSSNNNLTATNTTGTAIIATTSPNDKTKELIETIKKLLSRYGIVILLKESKEWLMLGLLTSQDNKSGVTGSSLVSTSLKPSDVSLNRTASILPANTASNATSVTSTNLSVDMKPFELLRWSLSSEVTASCWDVSRSVLGLGLRDGTVSLWDLRTRTLCGGDFGRHESAVISMALSLRTSNNCIVTAALDGSLAFFRIDTGPDMSVTTKNLPKIPTDAEDLKAFGVFRVTLTDFRHDVVCPIVHMCPILETGFMSCVTGEGQTLLYDMESRELVGTCCPKASPPGAVSEWMPLCVSKLSHLHPLFDISGSVTDEKVNPAEYPATWPAIHRSTVISPIASVKEAKQLEPLFATCMHGVLGIYEGRKKVNDRFGQIILGAHTLSHMLRGMCPGLAAVYNSTIHESAPPGSPSAGVTPIHLSLQASHHQQHAQQPAHHHETSSERQFLYKLFRLLEASQRYDATLKKEQVVALRKETPTVTIQDTSLSKSGMVRSPSRRSPASPQRAPSGLTEQKLKALNSSLSHGGRTLHPDNFINTIPNNIGLVTWEKVKDPNEIYIKAKLKSRDSRVGRSSRLSSRIQELSELF